MERCEPPFGITNRTPNRVSSISEKLSRIETRRTCAGTTAYSPCIPR